MKKSKIIYLVLLLLLAGAIMYGAYRGETKDIASIEPYVKNGSQWVHFSREDYFSEDAFELELSLDPAVPDSARIVYTLNGDTPTENSTEYTAPIRLEEKAKCGVTVIPVSCAVVYRSEVSDTVRKNYVICGDRELFSKMKVVSVTSDNDGLFGYENGILVNGKAYDDYLSSDDFGKLPEWQVPINTTVLRGDEYIRDAYVEIYDGGEIIASQKAGLTVSGGASSYLDQKSLKICTGKRFDAENGKLTWDIYADSHTDESELSQLISFNRFVLRNGGQDRTDSFIRPIVSSALADACGIEAMQKAVPVIVFLNGDYYSIAQAVPSFSNDYLSETFGLPEQDSIEKFEYSDLTAFEHAEVLSFFKEDLNDPNNRVLLEERVDVYTLLKYFAFEMYCGNLDWPGNNVKLWRYTGDFVDTNPYTDGRLRPVLYDFDKAMQITSDNFEQFYLLLDSDKKQDNVLYDMLSYSGYRDYFISYLCFIMSGPAAEDSVSELIKSSDASVTLYEENPLFQKAVLDSIGNREKGVSEVWEYLLNRPDKVRECLLKLYGIEQMYSLTCTVPEGSSVDLSGATASGETFTSEYYTDVAVTLKATVGRGYDFVSWSVNGEEVFDEVLTLKGYTDDVTVILNVKKCDEGVLVIKEVSYKGSDDWIKLKNVGGASVLLSDYSLILEEEGTEQNRTDTYTLPDKELFPGEEIILYCENSAVYQSYVLNFKLHSGDTVCLFSGYDKIQEMYLPKLQKGETVGISDISGKKVYFKNKNK